MSTTASCQVERGRDVISQKVLVTSFCKSQVPHKSVDLSFVITSAKS